MAVTLEDLQKEVSRLVGELAVTECVILSCVQALNESQRRQLINDLHMLSGAGIEVVPSTKLFTLDQGAVLEGFHNQRRTFIGSIQSIR